MVKLTNYEETWIVDLKDRTFRVVVLSDSDDWWKEVKINERHLVDGAWFTKYGPTVEVDNKKYEEKLKALIRPARLKRLKEELVGKG